VNTDGSVNTSNYRGDTETFYTQSSARPEGYIYFSNVGAGGVSLLSNGSDFNLDGKDDIAWYESWNNGTVTGLLSNGTTFSPKSLVKGMGKPDWAGVGDFNGDKRGDLVWYHATSKTIYLLKGTPEGGYGIGGQLTGMDKPDWAGVK
jgi:hypothetical protein